MKKFIRILFISFMLSCSTSPQVKFNKSGISFTCPAGWKITDEENIDSSGYYLSCEKKGINSSGLYTLSWVNDSVDLDNLISIYQNELKNNVIYKHANPNFKNPVDTVFKSNMTKACRFSSSLLGVKHEGIIYCFYSSGKTISILQQGAVEDTLENNAGFEILINSFSSDEKP